MTPQFRFSIARKKLDPSLTRVCRAFACAGVFFVALLPACKTSSPPANESPLIKTPLVLPDGSKGIPMLGENFQSRLAKSGDRFLFVSRGRAAHRQPQIYEYSFLINKERRLTFNDSPTWSPEYHPKDPLFFYSSATDESKENKAIFQRQVLGIPSPGTVVFSPYFPVFEELNSETSLGDIYSSTFDGFEIERWIRSPGLQTDFRWDAEGKVGFYSSFAGGQIKLIKINGGKSSEWTREKSGVTPKFYFFPEISSSRKELAWVESSVDGKTQNLLHSSLAQFLPQTLLSFTGQFRGLAWAQEGLWLIYSARKMPPDQTSSSKEIQNFDLFAVRMSDSCTLQLTHSSYDEIYPSWNSATSEVYFSANLGGSYQIYARKLNLESCTQNTSSPETH